MKYVKYSEFTGTLQEDEILLMSHDEFEAGGKEVTNIPVCITFDGSEPKEEESHEFFI